MQAGAQTGAQLQHARGSRVHSTWSCLNAEAHIRINMNMDLSAWDTTGACHWGMHA
jgi:hypothetical protein